MTEVESDVIRHKERDDAILEYTKHFAAIHSGAIAFLVAVFHNFNGGQKRLVGMALIAFVLGLAFSVSATSISLWCFYGRTNRPGRGDGKAIWFTTLLVVSGLLIAAGFLLVVIATLNGQLAATDDPESKIQ